MKPGTAARLSKSLSVSLSACLLLCSLPPDQALAAVVQAAAVTTLQPAGMPLSPVQTGALPSSSLSMGQPGALAELSLQGSLPAPAPLAAPAIGPGLLSLPASREVKPAVETARPPASARPALGAPASKAPIAAAAVRLPAAAPAGEPAQPGTVHDAGRDEPPGARQSLETGAAQVDKGGSPEARASALGSLFTGSRAAKPGETEVLVALPASGETPSAALLAEHGARAEASLPRLGTIVLKAPSDQAGSLVWRLGQSGFHARLGESFRLRPANEDIPVFERVSLSDMARVTRADLLQAELKKALGEPVSPSRERFRHLTMEGLAIAGSWLKRLALKALGIGTSNPVLPWAILDTYVKTDHAFLRERIEKEVGNKPDDEIHGTHTAGTVVGVDVYNWHGRVYNIMPGGWYDQAETLRLVNQAAEDGAVATTNSWGKFQGDPDSEETRLFRALAADGVHSNIAAGNAGEWGSDSVGAPGIAYNFTPLTVNGVPVGRAKRIKTVANADQTMKTAESSSRGPGSVTTAENFEEYIAYPRKPDEAGIGMHLVAPTFGPGQFVKYEPELGGLGRPLSGTSMATPGTFGGFLLLTRAVLVLLKDYLPALPSKGQTLFAMDLARYAMTKTGRKVAPAMEQGDGFVDVWSAFEYSAALLKATDKRLMPRVRESLRRRLGLGGYGDVRLAAVKAELAGPPAAEEEPGPKPPFAIQRPLARYRQPGAITATLFDADARRGYVSTVDGSVRKLDLATGEPLWSFRPGMEGFNGLALSPDGRLFAAGEDNSIRVLDPGTGAELAKFRGAWRRGVKALLLSPDGGRAFAAAGDGKVYMIDVHTGAELRRFEGHKDFVLSLALSGDGKTLFSGSGDRTVRQWDVETGRFVRSYPVGDDWVYSLAVTKDGSRLFTGSSLTRLWDTATGKLEAELSWKTDWVHSLTLTPDSKYLIAALSGKSVVLWDVEARGKAAMFKGHKSNVISVSLSADERHLLSGGDDPNLLVWDVPARSELPKPVEDSTQAPPGDEEAMPGKSPDDGKESPAGPGRPGAQQHGT